MHLKLNFRKWLPQIFRRRSKPSRHSVLTFTSCGLRECIHIPLRMREGDKSLGDRTREGHGGQA